MKKVAIYIRVSTQEQALEGYSIQAQKDKTINYCKSKENWVISEIFIDPGYSAKNLNRPAIQKLIENIKDFDTVVVWKLDRLSRSQQNTMYLIEDVFLKNKVDIVSLRENLDTATPWGIAMIGILSSFAQYEREAIRERTMIGKQERAKDGLYHGSLPPIGYDYINGQLIINEYEALQVKEVFSLYLEGHGTRKIANFLNGKGYKHKHGSWQNGTTVINILTNPLYAGQIQGKGKVFQGQHEGIIEKEIFEQVKILRVQREATNNKAFRRNSLLSGMIFCGFCGGRYHIRGGSINCKYRYYICYSKAKNTKHMIRNPDCNNKTWKAEELEPIIEKKILHLSIDENYTKSLKKNKKEKGPEREKIIRKKIEELNGKINKLLDLYQVDSTTEVKEIGERISKVHEEKKALEETLKNLEFKEEKPATISKEFKNFLTAIPEKWKKSDLHGKRKILEALIEKIVLSGEEVKIIWRKDFYIPIQSPYIFI